MHIAINDNAFASTFYFYLRTMQPHEKIKRACKPLHGDCPVNSNDTARNVNRFGQSECGLQTVVLRLNSSGDAHNISLNEILKKGH